ncbi:HAD-like domain-containing protein [Roridomyces roridus]|uniref:HAD-like domain-containing protein n=1 Tax=Roridomyces roridus TaxID=1738132 RepID=A0AAD7FX13_9AGAR|nr:HAD-like domain-containing protein [Roridomyces roridus]
MALRPFNLSRSVLRFNPARRQFQNDATAKLQKPPLAFVFDIDGVLIRGEDVLPSAKRALAILEGNNPFGKLPYILLTNGGGVSEKARCQKLTEKLGFEIRPTQYIQAHTILKTLSSKYEDTPVLVLGGKLDQVRKVAIDYGFKRAYTSLDFLSWNPSVWPFHQLTPSETLATKQVDFFKTPISAVFVFHDPRNWALDVQVICDVIQSGGFVGGPYVPLDQQKNPVELVFCNPDLIWRSDFSTPRLGQGAFKEAFQAVFKALTGSEYPHVQFGKPTRATYDYATTVLHRRVQEMTGHPPALSSIYMIGDNPESDIAGANAANWNSVLVKTGVFDGGVPTHQPTHVAEDVEEAVTWAIGVELDKLRQK